MKTNNYAVIWYGSTQGWKVKRIGSHRASSTHKTREAAKKAATKLVQRFGGYLYLMNKNGQVSRMIPITKTK